jgi:uncharacterized protein (DUF58 family)
MATVATLRARLDVTERASNWLKQRVRTRRGPATLPFELEYRHVYVLPTKFGWGFGMLLVFMALGGLNFNNNMALLLVFLLGTIVQLTTLIAYRNLSGLTVDNVHAGPVFCGEDAHFRVFISNGHERQRFAIQAGFKSSQDCRDIAPDSCAALNLSCPTRTRGWLEMPSFRLETRFPFGFFKAWSWIFPRTRCLVYPSPARKAPPLPKTGYGQAGRANKGDGDQVHGLRKYQTGDSLQRIAWRASARHDELYALEMEIPRESAVELDWDLLAGMDVETRLSVLTAWVVAADHKQLSYSLKLPDASVPAGSGIAQRLACLELLALYAL